MSTLKQRERAITRAAKNLRKAAESLDELTSMASEYGVDTAREEHFSSELRERAAYWENCRWWQQHP